MNWCATEDRGFGMLLRDDTRNRWFLVMRPGDGHRSGSAWFRIGPATRGGLALRPIAPQGWIAIAAFAAAWGFTSMGVWVLGYGSGAYSAEFAILATVLIAGAAIAGFIRLMAGRIAYLPPRSQPR